MSGVAYYPTISMISNREIHRHNSLMCEILQGDGKTHAMRPVSTALALGSAVLYGGAAVSMNFVNKLTLQVNPSAFH